MLTLNLAKQFSVEVPQQEASQKIPCTPFLKWVGGKRQLLPELLKRIPIKINRYYEPFIGGGALFFKYQPSSASISDLNPELINVYKVVQCEVEALIEDLKQHFYEEDYFYKIRDLDRSSDYLKLSPVQRASRLIFLNKTCFNGLYRVNSKGFFNTPFGRYSNPTILDAKNLRACSQVLKNVSISLASFDAIEDKITPKDFVYFDPPYVPLSTTSYFTSYDSEGFDLEMQNKLFELCERLHIRGVPFMLSNSCSTFVIEKYQKFQIELVSATRAINSKSSARGRIKEVIITNFHLIK